MFHWNLIDAMHRWLHQIYVDTVGISISTDEAVPRSHILEDFKSRGLSEPVALLEGDAIDEMVRDNAIEAIDGQAFDVIITDPPYGIREAISGASNDTTTPFVWPNRYH